MKTRLLFVMLAVITLGVLMTSSAYGAVSVNFTQCGLNPNNKPPVGPCDFIGSNSIYSWSDGMAVPQRIYFQNIAATGGNVHTVSFQWQWSKNSGANAAGTGHAYDYLVSWDQARQLAKLIRGFTMTTGYDGTLTGNDPCQGLTKTDYTDCRALHNLPGGTPGITGYPVVYTMSDTDTFTSAACDPGKCIAGDRMAAFSAIFGPRTISFYSKAPITINSFSLAHTDQGGVTLVTSDNQNGGNTYVTVTIQYTSNSDSLIIETASHVGVGCSPNIPDSISWGCNMGGASVFSGSPYHFQNPFIDGSTGSRDNQIQIDNAPPTLAMSTQLSHSQRTFGQVVTDTLTITGTATIAGTAQFFRCYDPVSPKVCLPTDPTNTALGAAINVNPTNSTATSFTILQPWTVPAPGPAGTYCVRVDYISTNAANQSTSSWSTTGECVSYSAPTAVTLSSFGAQTASSDIPLTLVGLAIGLLGFVGAGIALLRKKAITA